VATPTEDHDVEAAGAQAVDEQRRLFRLVERCLLTAGTE
jgi:hypothetical protein